MERKKFLKEIADTISNIDTEKIDTMVSEALQMNIPPEEILEKGLAKGLEIVGERYESGEYFLSELIMASECMSSGLEILKPHLQVETAENSGRVIIGTVRGDLHDIGKNLFSSLLTSSGFEVLDLGNDVIEKIFIEKAKEMKANILALSALLSTTWPNMKTVVEELKKAGIKNQIKVIVGGAPLTSEIAKNIGADAYGEDVFKGLRICKEWMKS